MWAQQARHRGGAVKPFGTQIIPVSATDAGHRATGFNVSLAGFCSYFFLVLSYF
jgi:hypothetical protein